MRVIAFSDTARPCVYIHVCIHTNTHTCAYSQTHIYYVHQTYLHTGLTLLSDSTSWSRPRSLSTSSCEARNARDSAATRLPVCTVRANSRELAAGPVRAAEGAFARVRASSWVSDTPAMGVRGVVVELGSGVPVARWY